MRLHVVPAQGPPFDVDFEGDELVIGRSTECGLTIADRFLSRRHARLVRDGDTVRVEDLGSRNGTLLNGRLIPGPTPIGVGDTIKISGSLVSVVAGPGDALVTSGSSFFRPASRVLAERGSHASSAITDATALRHLAERLELLNEVHQVLARPIDSAELLEMILDRACAALRPERAAIWVRSGQELHKAAERLAAGKEGTFVASRSLVEEVIDKGNAALVLDALTDARFAAADSLLAAGVKSLIAAPLLDDAGTLGMLALESTLAVRQFTEDDLELLVSLASIAALRLRNLALAEEAAARRHLEEELALARRIQRALLPEQMPRLDGWELVGSSAPSRGVSGDTFKAELRDGGRELVLMLADVSGKGMSAALLGASLDALSAAPIEDGRAVDEIADKLSRLLWARTPAEKYATAFLASLEVASGRLTYTNAGHNPGLLVRADGSVEDLVAIGPPLGLLPAVTYGAATITLEPGDALVLYTDGISEAATADGEELGRDRLAAICARLAPGAAAPGAAAPGAAAPGAAAPGAAAACALAELPEMLERELAQFVGDEPFADDRTLLALRRSLV